MYICIYLCIHTYIYIYIIYLQNGRSREDACVCVCCVHVRLYALLYACALYVYKKQKKKKKNNVEAFIKRRDLSRNFLYADPKNFLTKEKRIKKYIYKKKDKSVCVRLLHAMKLGAIVLLLLLTLLLLSRELYKDFFPRDLLLTR